MKKKTLRKDIKKCFAKSKGRFFSILCLIALGSFALVGLKVAGPDMRKTGENYFNSYNLADITIIGDYGIDEENQAVINQVSGAKKIEYGYLKDVVIKDTQTSVRVFSATDGISDYELVDGRMPEAEDEIAIASYLSDDYAIGDTISFEEKEDMAGDTVLKYHDMTVVGYVNSSELLSIINMGQSTAGTGELQGYAVTTADAFDSDVYMIARLSFTDTEGVDPYSDEYTQLIAAHKDELDGLLADQPAERLETIRSEYQEQIDDAQQQIDDAKAELNDALTQLNDGEAELADAKQEYADGLEEYNTQKEDAESQLSKAAQQLTSARGQISSAESELKSKKKSLADAKLKLTQARETLDAGWESYQEKVALVEQLNQTKAQLDAAQSQLDSKIEAAEASTGMTVDQIEAALPMLQQTLPEEQYQQLSALVDAKHQLDANWESYDAAAAQAEGAEEQLAAAKAQLDSGEEEYAENSATIEAAEQQIAAAEQILAEKKQELAEGQATYNTKKAEADSKLADAQETLDDAAAQIADAETELADGWAEYNEKKPDADADIADAEQKVADAQEKVDSLKLPTYAIDTRREIPGSEGYRIYGNVTNIIDALANVFPIFLYFVAALVTLTTMTRFVDEERINSGTLKALGYCDRDIVKKFSIYGLTAGLSGAVLGIVAGHTLLPLIVYNAYGKSFTYPRIELHFYPITTLVAVLLALLCTVVPALVVAKRELKEKPAALLQAKPPEAGSKILLERIPFIWNHMSFTHKVTARNLFRYKKRMLMTIFGVCGSVALIFAGFSVQHSISGIKDSQFGTILKYDLIVAQSTNISDDEEAEIENLLAGDAVKNQMSIHYETVTKAAGENNDDQQIKLIVPENADAISDYITLRSRTSGEKIHLADNGCVISERLAKLLDVKAGDTITFKDENKTEYTVTVAGVTEMYTGHFMFMTSSCYESVFGKSYFANAYMVSLVDSSTENANDQACTFMALDGVKSVVQNTTMTNQVDTIVHSLNKIMQILIIVAMLLAVVIQYNLTNINVSERIRELSTIKVLGFYNKEVTMYIYRETILLTAIGIIAGFGLGDGLYRYIISVVPPDDVMFNPALGVKAFVVPVIVISVITIILAFIMHRKLKNVDMLEALKSVE